MQAIKVDRDSTETQYSNHQYYYDTYMSLPVVYAALAILSFKINEIQNLRSLLLHSSVAALIAC